jgi:hypothetical protein
MATNPDVSFATRVSNKLFPKRAAEKAHKKMIMEQIAAITAQKDMENFLAMNAAYGKTGYSDAVTLKLLKQGQDGVTPDFAETYIQNLSLSLQEQGYSPKSVQNVKQAVLKLYNKSTATQTRQDHGKAPKQYIK